MTYNALRRFLPTGADILKFDTTVPAGIGNWQDTPKSNAEKKRGRLKDQMAKRYAGVKVLTAGYYKIQIVAAVWDAAKKAPSNGAGSCGPTCSTATPPRRSPTYQMTEEFKVNGPAAEAEDPQCMPRLFVGVLRHRRGEPVREVPPSLRSHGPCSTCRRIPSDRGCTLHQSWAAGRCRPNKFRKDPIRQGLGLKEAARTGERPCPRCVKKLGASAWEVMAEFCLTDNA